MRLFNLALFSLTSLLVLAGCRKAADSRQPEKMVVGISQAETLTGAAPSSSAPEYIAAVHANEETDFSFKVGGIIELLGPEPRRDWEEGNTVKAGTVLGRLQQSDFKNALASAKANSDLATSNNERLRKLVASNAVSKQEADKSKAAAESAQADLKQAQENLRDSELRAPWDGVVFARYANSRETVGAGKPVLRFGDLATMSVELGVPDRLVARFTVDKEIDVNISALPGRLPFRGRISEVGVSASREGRLYRVVIKVPNPDRLIRSGMTATVQAGELAGLDAGQVQVPLSALVAPSLPGSEKGKPQTQLGVFVVIDGKALLRLVKTGDIVASSIFVSEGLTSGEQVVTRGAALLYDGAPVEVR